MTTDEELLRHQAALQAEADAVHADLGLETAGSAPSARRCGWAVRRWG
ncbi:hypothetical protein ACIG0C_05255 [Kitasatospora aureofaciens]|nr:hypothetical protein [Kitasatospora aureofaciens]